MKDSSSSGDWLTISSASSRPEGSQRETSRSFLKTDVLNEVTNQFGSSPIYINKGLGALSVTPHRLKPTQEGFSLDLRMPDPIIESMESDTMQFIENPPAPPPQTHSEITPSIYAIENPIGTSPEPPSLPLLPYSGVTASAALTAPGVVGEAARKMLVDLLAAGMDPSVALYVARVVAKKMRRAISTGDDPNEAMSQIIGTTAGRSDTINRALEFLKSPDLLLGEENMLPTVWRPAQLFLTDVLSKEFALLVLNQPIENVHVLKVLWQKAIYRIAADGGGNRIRDAFEHQHIKASCNEHPLNAICGDLDSLDPAVQKWAVESGAAIIQDSNQDSTDFSKCVNYLQQKFLPKHPNGIDIVCLGGLGGRVDQGMSTVHHLFKFQSEVEYTSSCFYLLSSEAITFVLMPGVHHIQVKEDSDIGKFVLGKHIGIIPIGRPAIISTKGLEWDVTNWHTEIGGQISTSNHVKNPVCEIFTTAPVLFTIELKPSSDDNETPVFDGV